MASSSSPKPHNIYKIIKVNGTHDVQQVDEKAKAEETDLLELRLGRGFGLSSKQLYMGSSSSSSCCSSFSLQQPKRQHIGLDLGLGLGCSRPADRDQTLPMPCSIPSVVPSAFPFQLRPQPGLWFTLRSSPNRKREISLPQIPKMYIRVKDDKVTVLMVKTYLVTKLGLSNEAEIEILCRGQRLMNPQMLKHVRDTIWLPRLMESVVKSGESCTVISISNGVPVNHLMCLDYERKC
ncbi:hypothetical protein POM88_004653 [Heracleum sosnowskyi]|uniref:Ubiquitin-like domain-containing protein n=1 Tax=Heracleum sosnowskyi TaxID=360622 RepID=A0AAD8NEM8_9APIA|nr:hypothetical protein POM88_004653 [Heracleum sosnowskyi]